MINDPLATQSRQILLPELGPGGQDQLRKARVLVVGAGGLGCPALIYLASAGVGGLTICDGDRVEISNLNRQTLYSADDVGRHKAAVAAEKIRRQFPSLSVEGQVARVTIDNILEIIGGEHLRRKASSPQDAHLGFGPEDASRYVARERHSGSGIFRSFYDVIIDGTDNLATKFLLHDFCHVFGVPLVHASIYRFEGQVQIFAPGHAFGCLRCQYSDKPHPPEPPTCSQSGVIGFVPGLFGTIQAAEAIKWILNWSQELCEKQMLMDVRTYETQLIRRPVNENCPFARGDMDINQVREWHETSPVVLGIDDVESAGPSSFIWCLLGDVAPYLDDFGIQFQVITPMSIPRLYSQVQQGQRLIIICQRGINSGYWAKYWRDQGMQRIYSLDQGLEALIPYLLRPRAEDHNKNHLIRELDVPGDKWRSQWG